MLREFFQAEVVGGILRGRRGVCFPLGHGIYLRLSLAHARIPSKGPRRGSSALDSAREILVELDGGICRGVIFSRVNRFIEEKVDEYLAPLATQSITHVLS